MVSIHTSGLPDLAPRRPLPGRKIELYRSAPGANSQIKDFGFGARLAGGLTESAGREEQQDSLLMGLSPAKRQLLIALADGTQQTGERVSNETLKIMGRNFYDDQFSLADSAREANRWVRHNKSSIIFPWAGTTLVACLIDQTSNRLQIVHSGDSRGYLFRDGQLQLLTLDQTALPEYLNSPADRSLPVKQLIDLLGDHNPAGAYRRLGQGPYSPLLSRLIHDVSNEYCRSKAFTQKTELLGVDQQLRLGHTSCYLKRGDWFFAFSDGVHSCCSYAELSRWISHHQKEGPYELSRSIYRMLSRNGRLSDNVTIAAYHQG